MVAPGCTKRVPRSGSTRPAAILSSVDLPDPLRPTRHTRSPDGDRQLDAVEERRAPEGERDVAELDEGRGHWRGKRLVRGRLYGVGVADWRNLRPRAGAGLISIVFAREAVRADYLVLQGGRPPDDSGPRGPKEPR